MKKLLLTLLIIVLNLTFSETAIAAKACDGFIVYDRNDTSVNVRKSPNGQIIKQISNGIEVSVIEEKNGWYYISYGEGSNLVKGYMKKELLWLNSSCRAFDNKDTYVNLREQASTNSRVIRRVNNGTPVTCLNDIPSNLNTWVKVKVEDGTGKVGYMYGTKVGQPSCG
jgi:SH3-like domain-containing protein